MEKKNFETELKKIVDISKDFGADKVILFGSCLENIESAQDIDIAISGIKPREFFRYYGKVTMAVKDEVDIVDLKDVKEYLYRKILSKGKVLYERKI